MVINYGSAAYFIPFIATAAFVALLYFIFRRRSARAQTAVIFVICAVNILQHFLKQFIYPHYAGMAYPDLINTAYNMCATLIIITPFVLFSKNSAFRPFLACVGTVAGVLTMIVPHWYIGQTFFQWDVLRYYLCHGLLVSTSLLPALWGLYKFRWYDFIKFPFLFFLLLILIAFNDLVFWCLGVVGNYADGKFFDFIYQANPCWMMHPNDGFGFVRDIIDIFTPDIFFGDGAKPYTPILWYAIPVTLLFWVLGFIVCALIDRRRFVCDMRAFCAFIRRIFGRSKVIPVRGNKIKYAKPRFSSVRRTRRK